MLEGDRLLRELAQARHQADLLHRLAIFKELMANKELCEVCGASKSVWRETFNEEHYCTEVTDGPY